MTTVAMIGVGKLGQDCAEVMAEQYDVVGYDINPRNPAFPMVLTIQEAVAGRDIIFIAAPTPHDPMYGGETPTRFLPPKDFDYTIVSEILDEVNKYVTPNQLVVLISTVLPGTVRSILRPKITNARFIYNPYLIAMGTTKHDMVNPEMLIIGTEDGSVTGDAAELIAFYKPLMKNDPRIEIGTWDEAESIKIFYNTFISTKVALVNMIQDVAERSGNINVDVVTNALSKSTHRIMGPAYMTAGMGDGGACHPRDNIALRYLANKLNLEYDLFDGIMTAREKQALGLAQKCHEYGNKVTIIGKAYKPGVPYTNGSSSLLVGYYLETLGVQVSYHDIHTGDIAINDDEGSPVFLIGYWEKWVEEFVFPPGSIVIDPWRKIVPDKNVAKVIHYGNTRQDSPSNIPYKYDGAVGKYHIQYWEELKNIQDDAVLLNARRGANSIFHLDSSVIVEIINNAVTDKKYVVFDNAAESFSTGEVKLIYDLLEDLKVPASDIYYLTASVDAETIHDTFCSENGYQNKINIVILRTFEIDAQHSLRVDKKIDYVTGKKEKTYLCMNRMPHLHRVALLGLLADRDLIDSAYYSYYDNAHSFKDETLYYVSNLVPNQIEKVAKALFEIKDNLPLRLTLDAEFNNPYGITNQDSHLFENSYFSVIPETHYFYGVFLNEEGSTFFSEKTFNAINVKHPFIMVNRPQSLAKLKELGYKTFHPYIDETYDTIENDEARLVAIVDEVERLNKLSDTEWLEWQANIIEIVEHNHAVLHAVNPNPLNKVTLRKNNDE
jgi:UDPglucose 6-dehydrogenase